MVQVLRDLPFAYTYIDDVLLASSSPKEHKQHLRAVLEWFSEHEIVINPSKCEFGVPQLTFLSHTVDQHGICPLLSKVETLLAFPQPTMQRKLREFLGLVNFYNRFISNCACILSHRNSFLIRKVTYSGLTNPYTPLTLLRRHSPKQLCWYTPSWTLHSALLPTHLMWLWGMVLQQFVDHTWQPLAYFSKSLTPTERKYSVFDWELLGIYLAINLHPYQIT